MTPARSYRVAFGESLGSTVQRTLDEAPREGREAAVALASFAEDSEYSDLPAQLLATVEHATATEHRRVRSALARARDWIRSRYGLREIIFPEKYLVSARHDVVVTYSSCLALVYFADDPEPLRLDAIARDPRRSHLYRELRRHPGIGLVATRLGPEVLVESRAGRARLDGSRLEVVAGDNPLEPYGSEPYVVRAIFDLVSQPNAGDIVLFGAYDGYDIVSFDDQVGAHGSAGGDQMYPFLITPPELDLSSAVLEDARDIHREVLARYSGTSVAPPAWDGGDTEQTETGGIRRIAPSGG